MAWQCKEPEQQQPWYWPSAPTLQWRHNDHDGVSNHQPQGCLLSRLFGRRSKKTSKLRVTGLYVGNSPVTGEFPTQMASNAENVSIWWCHHENIVVYQCSNQWNHQQHCPVHLNVIIYFFYELNKLVCLPSEVQFSIDLILYVDSLGSKHLFSHWGRVTHICVSKLTIIGADNGLWPGRRLPIIWTNIGMLSIEPLGTNLHEILIEIEAFSFKKMHLNMSSGKWWPFCLGLNVLIVMYDILGFDTSFDHMEVNIAQDFPHWGGNLHVISGLEMGTNCWSYQFIVFIGICMWWPNMCISLIKLWSIWTGVKITLTHWGPDKMAANILTTFSNAFFKENVWISIDISLKCVCEGQINNIPALVQIMAWRRPGDKPLSEPMMIDLLMHICCTLPQRVNWDHSGYGLTHERWHYNVTWPLIGWPHN